jgi:hypothetical protein
MVMTVDQTRQNDVSLEVEDHIPSLGKVLRGSDLLDYAVASKEASVFQLPALSVHGDDDFGILRKERCHGEVPEIETWKSLAGTLFRRVNSKHFICR